MPSQFNIMVFIRSHCLFLWLSPPPLSSFTAVFFPLFSAQIMNHKFYLPLTPQSSFHPCVTFLLWNSPLFEKVFLICPFSCFSECPFCTILHGSGRGGIFIPSSAFLGEWMAGRMNDWHSVGNMWATGQGTEWQIWLISRLRVSLQNGQTNGLGGKRAEGPVRVPTLLLVAPDLPVQTHLSWNSVISPDNFLLGWVVRAQQLTPAFFGNIEKAKKTWLLKTVCRAVESR